MPNHATTMSIAATIEEPATTASSVRRHGTTLSGCDAVTAVPTVP